MSALELYASNTEFPSVTAMISVIVLICTLLFIQVKMHLTYLGELELLKASIDKRSVALHADVDNTINRLTPLENVTNALLAAQENVKGELCEQEQLLEEHGEEIALVGVAAHQNTHSKSYHISLDEYIKKYLKGSETATVRQIFKHLSEDKALTEEWPKLYGEKAPKMTRHDVNRRLYTLLAHGELKMNGSAGPILWYL
jgi:flagellar biosynthesis chaperone FliJ